MAGTFLDNLPAIKDALRQYALKAEEFGWIDDKERAAICGRIDKDTITIGVIGQMKSGKSTFLNAFLFKDDVLPAASTPMTAALTEISYGEKKAIEAEFYTKEEWDSVKTLASQSGEDSKIKAAKELRDKSVRIEGLIPDLLGTKKSAAFEDLLEYVGADGKYTPITKAAKIVYPLDILKGAQIVDTPGFNDPVVSREERAVEFLSKADVVILLLYAGRAFDATDNEIVEKVRNVGVGKIVLAVNKFDVQVEDGKLDEDIRQYVIDQIKKLVDLQGSEAIRRLFEKPNPILISAQMALLGRMSMEKIKQDEDYSFYYKQKCEKFGISSQRELIETSRIQELETAIDQMLKKEKTGILVNKSLNEIQAKVNVKNVELDKQVFDLKGTLKNCSLSPEELEEKIKDANKQEKKIKKAIDQAEKNVEDCVSEQIKDAVRAMEQDRNASSKKLHSIVDRAQSKEEIQRPIQEEIADLQLQFKDRVSRVYKAIKTEFKTQKEAISDAVEDIVERYDEDGDADEYLKSYGEVLRRFDEMSMEDVFKTDTGEFESEGNFGHFLGGVVTVATLGIAHKAIGWISWKMGAQKEAHSWIDKTILPKIPDAKQCKEFLSPVNELAAEFIAALRKAFLDDFASSIREKAEECKQEIANREKNKQQAEAALAAAQAAKNMLKEQEDQAKGILQGLLC